jgi:replicative DNA helicase
MSSHVNTIEEDLIGLLLSNPDRYFYVAEDLRPEHFQVATCRAVFKAIVSIMTDGMPCTTAVIEDRMEKVNPGVPIRFYLGRIKIEAPEGVHVEELSEVLIDRWYREQGELAAVALTKMPADKSIPAEDLPERMIDAIVNKFEAQRPDAIYSGYEVQADILASLQMSDDEPAGFSTGLGSFDELLGPFEPGAVTVIAGATGMGKSALAQQIAWTMASQRVPVLFHTNEMTVRQAGVRCLMQMAHVDGMRITKKTFNAEESDRIAEAANRLGALPIYFDGKAKPRVLQLKVRAQRMIVGQKVRALIIDHLQFIEGRTGAKYQKEFERLSDVTGDLKEMAKALGIHVFVVSHLNRDSQNYDIKTAADIRRPRLADLHGSSTIEKDADNVIFVHRPVYYLERNEPDETARHRETWQSDVDRWRGRVEMIKAKRRGGDGFGIREMRFVDSQTRFVEPERAPLLF